MEICDRCNTPIAQGSGVRGRRKDGSSVILCADCSAEVKAKRAVKNAPQSNTTLQSEPPPTKEQTKPSGKKWYQDIGSGILMVALAVFLYLQLSQLETGEVSSVRVWWPLAILYYTLGL